jgi:hypothetical protein
METFHQLELDSSILSDSTIPLATARRRLCLHGVGTQRGPPVLPLHVSDLVEHFLERGDRGSFL